MDSVCKAVLLVLWAGFFILNLRAIIFKQIDAGIGLVWMVVAVLMFIGVFAMDSAVLDMAGDVVMLTMMPAQVLTLCLLYNHEKALTEVRRKNNELAMEIAMIYDHIKYV